MRADPGFWRQASPSLGARDTIRSDIIVSKNLTASYTPPKHASISKMAEEQISSPAQLVTKSTTLTREIDRSGIFLKGFHPILAVKI